MPVGCPGDKGVGALLDPDCSVIGCIGIVISVGVPGVTVNAGVVWLLPLGTVPDEAAGVGAGVVGDEPGVVDGVELPGVGT